MTDTPWTPGPWRTTEYNDGNSHPSWRVVQVVEGKLITPWVGTIDKQADARLIAAAPEMAELLEAAMYYMGLGDVDRDDMPLLNDTRALLARIRGET